MTPVPVKVTVRAPLPSLPSTCHVEVSGPSDVGANCTDSTIDVSAAITAFKGFESALKSPVGGIDEVMVSGNPPWSPRSKVIVVEEPMSTSPKLSDVGAVEI